MSAASLRDQLEELQAQQRQRYQRRKSTKLRQVFNEQIDGENPINAHQDDDLGLQTASREFGGSHLHDRPSQDDTSASEAELKHLQHQLQLVQLDNTKHRALISEKGDQIKKLEGRLEIERTAMGGGSSTATQRIVELSKRNRELGAENAVERNKVRLLQKKINELSTQQIVAKNAAPARPVKEQPVRDVVDNTVTSLQEELTQTRQKMVDCRNQCEVYKQELKVAHKVIAKEVGEGVSVSALISGVSGWRGRAQHIIALQNKVAGLKQKLESSGATTTAATSLGRSADARQKTALQKIEKERQKNLEETRLELDTMKVDFTRVQQQCSALKARNKTLTADVKSLKAKLAELTRKQNSHEHEEVYRMLMGSGRSTTSTAVSTEESQRDCEQENKQLQEVNRELCSKLERCTTELERLREPRITTLPPIKPSFQTGTSRNGKRPTSGSLIRKAASAGHPSLRQGECTSIEMHTLAAVSQVERDRLVELTSVLQERLDSMTDRAVRLESNLLTVRSHKADRGLARARHANSGHQKPGDEAVSDLETRLAIQTDENAVLKETLEETRREKMDDMKRLYAMLSEAKQLFVETLRTN